MKIITFLIAATLLSSSASVFAQHTDQINDGAGHYSIIQGSSTGGTYTLPSGGGVILTSISGVPEVVNMLGAYAAGTTYSMNDLVTSASPDIYYYSLTNGNIGHTPETSPANWQVVTINQLNVIHKVLTLAAPGFTSLMSIEIPAGNYTDGGRIQYTIVATDGGSQIATESGIIQYTATANIITCTTSDKLHLGSVNSGCTPGFFNPGSHPGVSIFDNVSFSSPAPIVTHDVYYHIINVSGQYNGTAVSPMPLRIEP